MNNELVSVVMPVYNAEKNITDSIQSVLNQTYSNLELILVDDCSTDNSFQICKSFKEKDSRIQHVKLDTNSGAAVARNSAISIAKGRYIAFLDSDDLWKESKIEKQLKFMQEKQCFFTFTEMEIIDEKGEKTGKIRKVVDEVDYDFLLKNTLIGCSTVLIDRKEIGNFSMPLIRNRQDTATWLGILKNGQMAYGLKEPLTEYRISTSSISSNKFKMLQRTWHMYRKIENLSLLKSSYVFSFYMINAILKRF